MSELQTSGARPPAVTTIGWLIMIGSGALVLGAFETVAGLQSLETTRSIEATLDDLPWSTPGVDVDTVRRAMHVAAFVVGGCAAAAAILGYQVLRRDRRARTALTALAVPMVLAGLESNPFVAPMVGSSIALLWMQPARDWLAGPREPMEL